MTRSGLPGARCGSRDRERQQKQITIIFNQIVFAPNGSVRSLPAPSQTRERCVQRAEDTRSRVRKIALVSRLVLR